MLQQTLLYGPALGPCRGDPMLDSAEPFLGEGVLPRKSCWLPGPATSISSQYPGLVKHSTKPSRSIFDGEPIGSGGGLQGVIRLFGFCLTLGDQSNKVIGVCQMVDSSGAVTNWP